MPQQRLMTTPKLVDYAASVVACVATPAQLILLLARMPAAPLVERSLSNYIVEKKVL
jgi:hypothetical protein